MLRFSLRSKIPVGDTVLCAGRSVQLETSLMADGASPQGRQPPACQVVTLCSLTSILHFQRMIV